MLLQVTEHFIRAGELGDKVVQLGLLGGEEVARSAPDAPGFLGMVAGYMVYETPHVPTSDGARYLLFGDIEAIGHVVASISVPAESAKRLVSIEATA